MATKKRPAARAFHCSGCKKKRKMAFIDESTFFGWKKYQCPYCGTTKSIG